MKKIIVNRIIEMYKDIFNTDVNNDNIQFFMPRNVSEAFCLINDLKIADINPLLSQDGCIYISY